MKVAFILIFIQGLVSFGHEAQSTGVRVFTQ